MDGLQESLLLQWKLLYYKPPHSIPLYHEYIFFSFRSLFVGMWRKLWIPTQIIKVNTILWQMTTVTVVHLWSLWAKAQKDETWFDCWKQKHNQILSDSFFWKPVDSSNAGYGTLTASYLSSFWWQHGEGFNRCAVLFPSWGWG